MKGFLKFLSYVLVATVASAATLILFVGFGNQSSYGKLTELGDLLEAKFIGETDQTKLEDAAANAMVESLDDRWSFYMSAQEYDVYAEAQTNSYVGVGLTIAVREDAQGFDIVELVSGGPAEEAGLQVGDVLAEIDGESCAGLTTTQAKVKVQGKEGTAVSLTVRRGEETHTFSVTRRRFETQVAEGVMLEDNIGLVTISNFDERCAKESIEAVEALLDQGAQALIFDVRNNPGGYKDELVELLDYLLPEGPLFRSEDYLGNTETDSSDADCLDIPMAVLVNENSYSAAEFFAAALREYDYGIVVGAQTSGKGYYQVTYKLSDGSAVNLSVGKYTTPNGVSLAGVGLTPDVAVDVDEETFAAIYYGSLSPEEDPQIQAAVAALSE